MTGTAAAERQAAMAEKLHRCTTEVRSERRLQQRCQSVDPADGHQGSSVEARVDRADRGSPVAALEDLAVQKEEAQRGSMVHRCPQDCKGRTLAGSL